jgi:D-sedoheptulose 7-phosphate isomerase
LDIINFYNQSLTESAEIKYKTLEACREDTLRAINAITNVYKNEGKIMFCGNGGSASDCQHLATELMIRLNHEVKRPALAAISLCTDPSMMTAGGNDIGFVNVFSRSVEGLGKHNDALIGISTSGNSDNVINAILQAKKMNIITICLLGGNGGKLKDLCDIAVIAPTSNTQRIQEVHITLGHIICECVEQILYNY